MSEWITTSAPYLAPRAAGERDPWAVEAEAIGHTGRHRLALVERRELPAPVAERLGIDPAARAILRRRVVTLDERPVEIADSWYPLAVAEGTGLAQDRPIRGGAARLLAELGFTAARHVEDVAIADPPDEAAHHLGPAPVLELIRTSFTADDVPFEVAAMLMSRDLAPGVPRRLRYELRPG
jgi:GntR family transcriptional regulator